MMSQHEELSEKPEQAMNYFDYLPDEILYEIILILSPFDLCTLTKVNHRLQRVCGDKRLWKKLNLTEQKITYFQNEMPITSSFPDEKIDLSWSWEQATNYFDDLPDEVLYKIISILSPFDLCTLGKVSQRLQRVCGDERLWKMLSLTKQQITYSQIEMLITSTFPIKEIDLSWSWFYQIPDVECHRRAASSNSHMTLDKLNMTRYGNSNNITYMLERFRAKELILDSTKPILEILTSEMLEAISKHEDLGVLSMEWTSFYDVGIDIIQKLFNGCSRLKELNLTGCQLSRQQLRVFCDHIPETVEKLVLLDATFDDRLEEFWAGAGDYEAYLNMEDDAIAESFQILFHRVKNLKYFGTPFIFFTTPAIMDRMIQYQGLRALRLCEYNFLDPNFASVLEKMTPKLEWIDIVLKKDSEYYWLTKEERASMRGTELVQLEKLKETFVGIHVEVYDEKLKRGIGPFLPRQQASNVR